MKTEWALVIVCFYCVVREFFFLYSTHKLINKVMSRNYYDFVVSEKAGSLEETVKSTGVTVQHDDPSDEINMLNGMLS